MVPILILQGIFIPLRAFAFWITKIGVIFQQRPSFKGLGVVLYKMYKPKTLETAMGDILGNLKDLCS